MRDASATGPHVPAVPAAEDGPTSAAAHDHLAGVADALAERGVATVLGTTVNAAGLVLGKAVAPPRLPAYATAGLGAAPVWSVFCVDGSIAFTPTSTVVGDDRLRLDAGALAVLDERLVWGPLDLVEQDGAPSPRCPRAALARTVDALAAAGLTALVGHELELVLLEGGEDERGIVDAPWVPYGAGMLARRRDVVDDLLVSAERAGLAVEQVHAEYAPAQFEISLAPADPVAAADAAVLARLVVCEVARRHGLVASFSPFPLGEGGGNGAHQHLSLARDGVPLLSGGDGPHGLTEQGGHAVAGLVAALPQVLGVLAGSLLSPERLRPGFWSGAHACWGLENREAAVRLVAATPANARGANVEVKVVDPSANPYLATAVLLGAALAGIEAGTPLPPEVGVDPATQPDATLLPQTQGRGARRPGGRLPRRRRPRRAAGRGGARGAPPRAARPGGAERARGRPALPPRVVALSAGGALTEHLEGLRLVDHHVHGAFAAQPDRQQVRDALVEADTAPVAPGTDPFDSQVGFAVRRHCAPLLDLPAHAPAEDYLVRREELGHDEVDARLLRAAGVGTWLVDTGHGAGLVQTPAALAAASGGTAREVVRLETVAEALVVEGGQDWTRRFTAALHDRVAAGAVGWKSVLAYRGGFDVDFSTPDPAAVQAAADRWAQSLAESTTDGGPDPRLTDPVLLVAGILAAVAVSAQASPPGPGGLSGLPLQLHVGFGDRDLDLHAVDPLLLRPLLARPDVARVPVMLLHCYPYERAVGYLAQAYANVHLDVGLTVPFLGARAAGAVARSLELAPFTRVLYSSDAWGLPELHLLGAPAVARRRRTGAGRLRRRRPVVPGRRPTRGHDGGDHERRAGVPVVTDHAGEQEWDELRRQADADVLRLAHDEADLAEVRAVQADLEHLRAE